MRDLLVQYLSARKQTIEMIQSCKSETDMEILKGILRDLEFTIKWIRSGHNPNDNRALDKRTVYLLDHKTIGEVIDTEASKIKVSSDEYYDYIHDRKHVANKMLGKLSGRELEVFLMMKCEGMSSRDVAELLDVKYTTVESHMERAKRKINFAVEVDELTKEVKRVGLTFDIILDLLKYATLNKHTGEINMKYIGGDYADCMNRLFNLMDRVDRIVFYEFVKNNSAQYDISNEYSFTMNLISNRYNKVMELLRKVLSKPIF